MSELPRKPVGILGGTFDPVHTGHLVLATQCREQLALDTVWLVPCGTPPHKDSGELADAEARYRERMAQYQKPRVELFS